MDDADDVDTETALHRAYARGSRVQFTGLVSRASLNGRMATVLESMPASNGRWAVITDPPNANSLRVKPDNIVLVYDPAMSSNPINLRKLLVQLDPADHHYNQTVGTRVTNKRIAQRKALVKVLSLAAGHNAADTMLNDPTCQILELSALDAITVQPCQLYSWALVCRAWSAAVKAWLASVAAHPFWQRACAGMLPPEVVLHPELCTKDMLRAWAALPMAVGSKQHWYRCGLGMAQNEEETDAMTELELGVALAQLFKLWWNVGKLDSSPRFVGWMRLYLLPYLDGRTHETEAHPGVWERNGGPMPMSLLANVCDCIQDFRMCPSSPPELIGEECRRTLCALVSKFDCQTPRSTQWRHMRAPQITPAKNDGFYALIRRYCPLFPQMADCQPREVVLPVFKRGERHVYEMPRPERWRLWPHTANMFLILDKFNSRGDSDHWEWDQDVMNRDERGVIEGEAFVDSEEEDEEMEGEDEDEDEDVEDEDDEDMEEQ